MFVYMMDYDDDHTHVFKLNNIHLYIENLV